MSIYLFEIIIKIIIIIYYILCIINIIKIYATKFIIVFFNKTINPMVANFLFFILNEIHNILRN